MAALGLARAAPPVFPRWASILPSNRAQTISSVPPDQWPASILSCIKKGTVPGTLTLGHSTTTFFGVHERLSERAARRFMRHTSRSACGSGLSQWRRGGVLGSCASSPAPKLEGAARPMASTTPTARLLHPRRACVRLLNPAARGDLNPVEHHQPVVVQLLPSGLAQIRWWRCVYLLAFIQAWHDGPNLVAGDFKTVAIFIPMACYSPASTMATLWLCGPDALSGGPDLIDAQ